MSKIFGYSVLFAAGFFFILALDSAWAQDDKIRVCRDTSSYPVKIVIVEAGQQCPPGYY